MIYGKWLEWSSSNCAAWIKFAHLERDLNELGKKKKHE